MKQQSLIRIIGLSGAIAVILGALGAHALKEHLSPEQIASFQTGVRYQMWHTIGLFALLHIGDKLKLSKVIIWLWIAGIILFSGSIYLLNLDDLMGLQLSFLGPITPLGGLCFIAGWILLVVGTLRK
ncbi:MULTISPECIES: DUF423 domain-containing protein [Croceimicrobium]|uniref:DUF423 domain-containing protein n=1 Tax=Croceimicrobium hydrocarbonivorans TaxID=2761580 RepID=A0A7H0VCE7_9FLAO|nr:DUF423 domain-containing protein [Croceimicrobium hydrocarbonivorans]QNR23395.1 DUF423 domain-containing protein [Croceimicrobium hydrocarbonivorans]